MFTELVEQENQKAEPVYNKWMRVMYKQCMNLSEYIIHEFIQKKEWKKTTTYAFHNFSQKGDCLLIISSPLCDISAYLIQQFWMT